jgi:hypothetical protein
MAKCKASGFKWFLVKLGALLRKVYSPMVYWFLYFVYLHHLVDGAENDMLHRYGGRFPEDLGLDELRAEMHMFDWRPEPRNGALDFTYRDSSFFVSDAITKTFGRDCDDFAYQWFTYFKSKGYDEVYNIILTTDSYKYLVKKSHVITIVRFDHTKDGSYIFLDNNRFYGKIPNCNSVEEVMQWYANLRAKSGEGYESTVWCFYRKVRNYK